MATVEVILIGHAGVSLAVDGYLFFLTIKIRTMGIIKQAVLGGFSGRVGTMIGSSWKVIAVMRGPIANRGNPTATEMIWKVYMDTGQRPEIPETRWMR